MSRTSEQKKADEDLENAINAVSKAYGHEGLVGDHVTIGAYSWITDQGEIRTKVRTMVGGEGLPDYRLVGLFDRSAAWLEDVLEPGCAHDDR